MSVLLHNRRSPGFRPSFGMKEQIGMQMVLLFFMKRMHIFIYSTCYHSSTTIIDEEWTSGHSQSSCSSTNDRRDNMQKKPRISPSGQSIIATPCCHLRQVSSGTVFMTSASIFHVQCKLICTLISIISYSTYSTYCYISLLISINLQYQPRRESDRLGVV